MSKTANKKLSKTANAVMWEVCGLINRPNSDVTYPQVLCVCATKRQAPAVVRKIKARTVDGCVLIGGHVQRFHEFFTSEVRLGSALEIAVVSPQDLKRKAERDALPF